MGRSVNGARLSFSRACTRITYIQLLAYTHTYIPQKRAQIKYNNKKKKKNCTQFHSSGNSGCTNNNNSENVFPSFCIIIIIFLFFCYSCYSCYHYRYYHCYYDRNFGLNFFTIPPRRQTLRTRPGALTIITPQTYV